MIGYWHHHVVCLSVGVHCGFTGLKVVLACIIGAVVIYQHDNLMCLSVCLSVLPFVCDAVHCG